jgi:hypothetical protein
VSASKPKLAAVEVLPADQLSAPLPQAQSAPPNRWIQAIVILALLAAASAAVWQTQRVETLTEQVEDLQVELGEAQGALGAYEVRFGEIGASVGGLRAQLGELEALVEAPPVSPPRR